MAALEPVLRAPWWADGMDLLLEAGLTVTSTLFLELLWGEAILAAEVAPPELEDVVVPDAEVWAAM